MNGASYPSGPGRQLVAGGGQGPFDLLDVGVVPRLEHQAEEAGVDIHVQIGPVVIDSDHVAAEVGDDFGYAAELARLIRQLDDDISRPPRLEQAAADNPGEDCHVDVAAREQADHVFALDRDLVEEDGGNRHRPGPFGDQLLLLDQSEDGGGDLSSASKTSG